MSAVTDLDEEVDGLTVEELETASGGRIKIEKPPAEIAREIAQLEADTPGFC